GLRLYPKAVAWSIVISTSIAMEGQNVCFLSSFYAFPQFNKKYGQQLPDATYRVPAPYQGRKNTTAPWQAGLFNGTNIGEIIGLFLNGWVSEKYGY
ncbi:hypothetical protein R3P38DRAFT_2421167, partial [Favolaschia claudopus]